MQHPLLYLPYQKKDLTLLAAGTSRDRIIKEFRPPASTYTDRDTAALRDVFRFRQGYSKGTRVGMLADHLAAMSTIGFRVVPQDTSMAFNVRYDDQNRVVEYQAVR